MAMPGKAKSNYNPSPSPSVVSTNCSSLKSFYRSCRSHFFSCSDPSSDRYLPINPTSRKSTSSASQVYWKKSPQLRDELDKLDELLNTKKNLGDGVDNLSKQTSSSIIESKDVNFDTGYCNFSGRKDMLKLGDGGFLHELGKNLAMQVSAPALISVEIGSSFSQVINRVASMGRDNLFKWLLRSLLMCDLSITGTGIASSVITTTCTEEGFLEAILIEGLEKLEALALKGMRDPVSVKLKVNNEKALRTEVECEVEDSLMEVMLIQMVDPSKGYTDVGDMMIGFIEASLAGRSEGSFQLQGVHVAGTRREREKCGYLWSVSTRNLREGSCGSHSNVIVINPHVTLSS